MIKRIKSVIAGVLGGEDSMSPTDIINDRLFRALTKGNIDVENVKGALQAGADPNALGRDNYTPLERAALKSSGGTDGYNGFHIGAIIKALLDAGADPNRVEKHEQKWLRDHWTPLQTVAYYGHANGIKALLDAGANPNVSLDTSRLMDASHFKGGGRLLAGRQTPLHHVAMHGLADCVKALLDKGADPNAQDTQYGYTPLHFAAWSGHTDCVNALLDKEGADPNIQDKNGCTPLYLTAQYGRLDCVKALLDKGADPNAQDRTGETALTRAVLNNQMRCVKALLDKGADPNVGDVNHRTPLHVAVSESLQSRSAEIAKALLDKGADPNAQDKKGDTPLHYAARRCNTAAIEVLLGMGADLTIRNDFDQRPVDCMPSGLGHTPAFMDELATLLSRRVDPDGLSNPTSRHTNRVEHERETNANKGPSLGE